MRTVNTTSTTDFKETESFTDQRINNACHSAESTTSKYAFSLDVYQKNDIGRLPAEQFIKDGFTSAYGADVDITMPYILAINNGKFKAALGIRAATENLFIEQYLAQPIEFYVSQEHVSQEHVSQEHVAQEHVAQEHVAQNKVLQMHTTVARKYIAEIGHLYSNSNKFTIPLFLTTAVSLFCNGYEQMVFAGTDHVVKLISKAGIECHYIAQADKNKLQGSSNKWGSYYETNPQVVFVSLASVMNVVNKSAHFKQMFDQLERKIALTTSKLKR